jgi:selenocysteine lyase/cysteine desulfurase
MYTDMARRGVEVTWVPMTGNGIRLEDLDRAIRPGPTKLIVSSTSFVNGFQHDLARVTARWHHVRAGVSIFNDMDDVERLIAALS